MQSETPSGAAAEQNLVMLCAQNMDALAAEVDGWVAARVSLGSPTSDIQVMRELLATRLASMSAVYAQLDMVRSLMDERRALAARADALVAVMSAELTWTESIIETQSIEAADLTCQLQSEVLADKSRVSGSFADFSALDARWLALQSLAKDKRAQILALQVDVVSIEEESERLAGERLSARREFQARLKTMSQKERVLQALLAQVAQGTSAGDGAGDGLAAMDIDPPPTVAAPPAPAQEAVSTAGATTKADAGREAVLAAAVAAADAIGRAPRQVAAAPAAAPRAAAASAIPRKKKKPHATKQAASKATASSASLARRQSNVTHISATQTSVGSSRLATSGAAAPPMEKTAADLTSVRAALASYIEHQATADDLSTEDAVAAAAAEITRTSGKPTTATYLNSVLKSADGAVSTFQPARLLRIAEFLRTATVAPPTQSLPADTAQGSSSLSSSSGSAGDDGSGSGSGGGSSAPGSASGSGSAGSASGSGSSGIAPEDAEEEIGSEAAVDEPAVPLEIEPIVMHSFDMLGSTPEEQQAARPAKRRRDEEDEGGRESTAEIDVVTVDEPPPKRPRSHFF